MPNPASPSPDPNFNSDPEKRKKKHLMMSDKIFSEKHLDIPVDAKRKYEACTAIILPYLQEL